MFSQQEFNFPLFDKFFILGLSVQFHSFTYIGFVSSFLKLFLRFYAIVNAFYLISFLAVLEKNIIFYISYFQPL